MLAAAAAISLNSCRSPLYYAAERGDTQTVIRQLARHEDVNDKPSKAHLWWQIPTYLVTVPVDITLNYGSIFILPLYVDNPFITTKWIADFGKKTPLEAALSNGKFDTVEVLIDNGAKCDPNLKQWVMKRRDLQEELDRALAKARAGAANESEVRRLRGKIREMEMTQIASTPD